MKCCQESGLLSVLMQKVIPLFGVLYFYVFDNMILWMIAKKKKYKDDHVHVEEQIGRTNIEEYYYVSKLNS